MKKIIIKLLPIAVICQIALFLPGCIDFSFENANYQILVPASDTSYVGSASTLPPTPKSSTVIPATIEVAYHDQRSSLGVYLNGSSVGEFAVLDSGKAVIQTADVQHLLVQGRNELLVEPLAFGPRIIFNFDNKGPEVVISSASTQSDGSITVSGYLRDGSAVDTLVLENRPYVFDGVKSDNTVVTDEDGAPNYPNLNENPRGVPDDTVAEYSKSVTFNGDNQFLININRQAQKNDHYRFITTDEYGYSNVTEYLADGQIINPLLKIRIGSTFLNEVKPLASAKGDDIYLYDKKGMELVGKLTGPNSIEEAQKWLKPSCATDYTESQWLALTVEERVATGCAAMDTPIFSSIRENHSAIYTGDGASHDVASECHETPAQFQCHAVRYINGNSDGTAFNRGDADSAQGQNWEDNANNWFCTDWSFVPAPTSGAGAKDGNVGRECSYVEMYTILSEDMTMNVLDMDHENNSELTVDLELWDSDGGPKGDESKATALVATQGIFHWQCGPVDVHAGAYKGTVPRCDRLDTSSCDNFQAVRLPAYPETMPAEDVKAAVNIHDWCSKGEQVTIAGGIAELGDIVVKDNGINPAGNILAKINNGNLDVRLKDFKFNFNDPEISVGMDAGWLAGALEDTFVEITESIIRNSINDFDLEFLLTSKDERKTALNIGVQAWEVNSVCTSNSDEKFYCGEQADPSNRAAVKSIDWEMLYRGKVKTVVADSAINEVLGSLYSKEVLSRPLDNTAVNEDNLSLAINSNIINQAFLAFYNTGMTHISMLLHQPTVPYFGASATDALGKSGNYRAVMKPKSPATIKFTKGTGVDVNAIISYTGAALEIDRKSDSGWENKVLVDLDMEIGVTLVEENQVIKLDILGAPLVEVNNVSVPSNFAGVDTLLEIVLEKITLFLMPRVVTDSLSIDLRDLPILDLPPRAAVQQDVDNGTITQAEFDSGSAMIKQKMQLSSHGIEANGQSHLGFSLGLNTVDDGKQP